MKVVAGMDAGKTHVAGSVRRFENTPAGLAALVGWLEPKSCVKRRTPLHSEEPLGWNTRPHQATKRLDAQHGYSRKRTSPRAPTRGGI